MTAAGFLSVYFDKSTQFPDFTDRFDEIWDIYTGSYCSGNAAKRFKTGIANWNRLFTALSGMNTEDKIKGIVIGGDGTYHTFRSCMRQPTQADFSSSPRSTNLFISYTTCCSVCLLYGCGQYVRICCAHLRTHKQIRIL